MYYNTNTKTDDDVAASEFRRNFDQMKADGDKKELTSTTASMSAFVEGGNSGKERSSGHNSRRNKH